MITPAETSMGTDTVSPPRLQPRKRATRGFTKVWVTTLDALSTFRSQTKAVKPMRDPKTTRYARAATDFMDLCDRYKVLLLSDVPCLSAEQREGKIARGTEDGAVKVEAGDRELPQLSRFDDSVRRFIALIDECYDRKVPVCIEAQVPMDQLYTQGYLAFAFRRTLSRLQEMQLQRFGQPL